MDPALAGFFVQEMLEKDRSRKILSDRELQVLTLVARGYSSQQIAEYAETAGAFRDRLISGSGKQGGDPIRAGEAIIKALESDNMPLRLVLGAIALERARIKIEQLRGELDAWEETSLSADYPESQGAAAR